MYKNFEQKNKPQLSLVCYIILKEEEELQNENFFITHIVLQLKTTTATNCVAYSFEIAYRCNYNQIC